MALLPGVNARAERVLAHSIPTVRERGPHHQRVEYISTIRDESGRTSQRTNSYVVLGTGINRWDAARKEWVSASDKIEMVNGRGVVRNAQHRLVLAPTTISRGGMVDLETPGGERIILQPVGLAVTDAAGRSVFLAEVKESRGEIVAPNEMLYRDAFDLVHGHISIKVSMDGVESDVILAERVEPELLRKFGIDPETARLEMWHEVLRRPNFKRSAQALLRRSGRRDPDHTVEFGGMAISAGTAFKLNHGARPAADGIPVAKEFIAVEGTDYLIESIPLEDALTEMADLPPAVGVALINADQAKAQLSKRAAVISNPTRTRPMSLAAFANERSPRQLLAARSDSRKTRSGFVIDYPITITTQTNFTFRGDTTYYVTNRVYLLGTTRLEGGAVIKTVPYDPAVQASVRIYGVFECLTSPSHPAIFTARDDDTVGERIAESTGVIATNIWYSHYNLYFGGNLPVNVHDIQSRHAHVGVYFSGAGPHQASNVQVYRCYRGIEVIGSTVFLRNALLHITRYAIHPPWDNGVVHAEHLTIDNSLLLFGSGAFGTLYLTNSLLCNVGNSSVPNVYKERVETVSPAAFQSVGRGLHYLANDSPHRDTGSVNISATTSALLRDRTTHPPVVLVDDVISDTTLARSAPRDTELPDLGFHYFPLDYCAGDVAIDGAVLTLASGVHVGAFGTRAFELKNGGSIISAGNPLQRNAILPYNAVQVETTEWGGNLQNLLQLGTVPGRVDLRYTDAAVLANLPGRRTFVGGLFDLSSAAEISFSDSRLINFSQSFRASSPVEIRMANNIFESCILTFEQGNVRGGSYAPLTLDFHNNLIDRGSCYFIARAGSTPWFVRDNFFNSDVLSASGLNANFAPDFNAFRPGLNEIGGPNNQTSVEPSFRSGPLGTFYFAESGSITRLIDAGSRTAGEAGLYHSTTDPAPLASEASSVVDIGFHYPSLDVTGNFHDSDLDSIPDVEEDRNGNGLVDAGETSHLDRDSDFDGVFDGVELSLGHDPLSEKSLDWKSLSSFRFDSGNFVSVEGSEPIVLENLVFTNGFRGLGADFSSASGPVILKYPGLEANGRANISLAQGSIRLRMRTYWFSKDPILDISPTLTYGGLGPQEWVTLIETTNLSVRIDPDGLKIFVLSRSVPGAWNTNLQANILVESIEPRTDHAAYGFSWWYDLLITYSAEETRLNWIAPGPGVVGTGIPRWQGSSTDNRFVSIGSGADGSGRINAVLDDIVIYNVPGVMHTNPWTFSAIASTDPVALNLVWPGKTNLLLDMMRRKWGDSNWEWMPGAIGTKYTDRTVVPGQRYEYNLNAGFLHAAGVHEPYGQSMTASVLGSAIENRGKVILLVDETLASAIQPELDTFHADLVGDGWSVVRANMPRHVDDYSTTQQFATNWYNITNRIAPFIRNHYASSPNQIKHVLLIGHVTVPHLGDQADDGHWSTPNPSNPYGSHQGTWSSDLYYSDVDGIWSDSKTVDWSVFPENRNSPADGKLDEDYLPPNADGIAHAEITVARIDFARLPAFAESETELLKRYLQKNHRFRHKQLVFEPNAIGADLFFGPQAVTHPEHMAAEMASKFSVLNSGVVGDVFTVPGSFILGAQSGSGFVDRINAVRPQEQTTEHFATNRTRPSCAFYLLRGSFFQDWNLENNFMKAILTPDNGGLAAGWFLTMGVWRLDPLASGLELGSLWRESVNTRLKSLWGGQSARATQILGDSTLRYPVLAPPTDFFGTRVGSKVDLNWTASVDPGCSYFIYRSYLGLNSSFMRVTPEPVSGTTFSELVSVRASPTYMIRAVKVIETGSGSFTNLSQGVFKAF